jgi:hypothetical protein
MFAILLACLALVAVPIIAVQYPRYLRAHADAEPTPSTADPGLDGAGEKTPTAASSSKRVDVPLSRKDEVPILNRDSRGTARSAEEEETSPGPWHRPRQSDTRTLDRTETARRGGDDEGGKRTAPMTTRKPWDPPFAMSPRRAGETYRILARSQSPVRDYKGKGEAAVQTEAVEEDMDNVFEPGIGHVPATEPIPSPVMPAPLNWRAPPNPGPVPKPMSSPPAREEVLAVKSVERAEPTVQSGSRFSVLQTVALILTFVICVFAFAVLIAHCLAWFIVYKTESRLGDVRMGLLRGGDMRVCLCAHG